MSKGLFWRGAVAAMLLLIAAGIAVGCGDDDNDGDSGAETPTAVFDDNPTEIPGITPPPTLPVIVQRSDGKEMRVEQPVQRIVSLSPGATEIIFALGAESRLVAVDNNADFPAGAAAFPTKVDAFQPNVESIVALNPDLVIVASNIDGIVEALDRLNIPVLYLDLDTDVETIDKVLGQIGIMGRLTDTNDRSRELIAELSARVKAVRDALPDDESGLRVYHELDENLYSVADTTFIGSLYDVLQVENIAGDGGGVAYPQLTQEAIISANPDIIVLADEAFGVTVDSVRARPGWASIDAVQNNRIFPIDPNIISRPGPRIVDALEQLARAIYPDGEAG